MVEHDTTLQVPARNADQKLDAEMQQYAGQWVAVVKYRVVAAGDSLQTVIDQARAKGYARPLVMRAPEAGIWVL